MSGNLDLPAPWNAVAVPRSSVSEAERAFVAMRALLRGAFAVYMAVVAASVLGLAPLGSRLSAWSLLLLGGLTAGLTVQRAAPSAVERTGAVPPRSLRWVGEATFALGLAATLVAWGLALLLPVGAYDALGYRLPAIAGWLDVGALSWVAGDDPLRNGYPLGLEVLAAVLFRAFDSAFAVDAVASLFVCAGALALLGLLREVGVSRAAARLAAGLFLLAPMHLLNAPSGYADAAFSGALVALLVAAARFASAERRGAEPAVKKRATTERALDLGSALALVIALKPHGFAFAGIALLAALASRVRSARRAAPRAPASTLADLGVGWSELASVLLLAAPGLFFAARNFVEQRNPLYPLELRAFGRVWLAGEAPLDGILTPDFNVPRELAALPAWARPLWVWLEPHGPAQSYDDRLAGFGYAFAALGLPALCWLALSWWRGRQREALRPVWFVVAVTWLCWLVQPLAFWPRFSSWLWGAAALAIALLVTTLLDGGRARMALALAALALAMALPEAAHALAHVKGLHRLGLGVLAQDSVTTLARVAGIERSFVERALLGRRDVCRTPWRLGTDDANIDGVVAQLTPRPRMHVIEETELAALPRALRSHGCDQLIAIGDAPLAHHLPPSFAGHAESVTAFGRCQLLSFSSALGESP